MIKLPLAIFDVAFTDTESSEPSAIFHSSLALVPFRYKFPKRRCGLSLGLVCSVPKHGAKAANQEVCYLEKLAVVIWLTTGSSVVAGVVKDGSI